MTIDSSQNVGLGTTVPVAKLEIEGIAAEPTSCNGGCGIAYIVGAASDSGIAFGSHTASPWNNWIQSQQENGTISALNLNPRGGNVGIGTDSPNGRLEAWMSPGYPIRISHAAASVNASEAYIGYYGSTNAATRLGYHGFPSTAHTDMYLMNDQAGGLGFGTSATVEMFIDSDGDVGIGTTNPTSPVDIFSGRSDGAVMNIVNSSGSAPRGTAIKMTGGVTGSSSYYFLYLHDNGGERMIVQTDGNVVNANNSYGGISDLKLKQDITDVRSYWDDFKAVKFRKYRLKSDVTEDAEAPMRFGVVAQELETVFPGLVEDAPDYSSVDGNLVDLGTVTKRAKYSILSQIGLKVVQELQTRLEDTVSRLETAEAKIATLEAA